MQHGDMELQDQAVRAVRGLVDGSAAGLCRASRAPAVARRMQPTSSEMKVSGNASRKGAIASGMPAHLGRCVERQIATARIIEPTKFRPGAFGDSRGRVGMGATARAAAHGSATSGAGAAARCKWRLACTLSTPYTRVRRERWPARAHRDHRSVRIASDLLRYGARSLRGSVGVPRAAFGISS